MQRKIVVIDANAAEIEAASVTRKKDCSVEITLITKEKTVG
jgi:hypothetical protein